MTTAQSAPSNPRDVTGQVLTEAARRMVPVLAGKLLTAVADQAVAKVEQLAERLDDYREHGSVHREQDPDEADGGGTSTTVTGTALAFLADQVRTALAVLARLIAQAAEMLRQATARLHARRAPEGIEAEHEEIEDDVEEFDEYDDEYEDEQDEEDAAQPAMA